MNRISVLLPIRTESEANVRECWQSKHRRAKNQRGIARMMLVASCRGISRSARIYVTLTRIGVRKLDSDNLARSFKAVRDGIADAIGIDDGSDRIGFHYRQERGRPKEYAVRVEIEEGKDA